MMKLYGKWEINNAHVMNELLAFKSAQCSQFRLCLLVNKEKQLLRQFLTNFGGTDLSVFATQIDAEFWPGQSILGALLMELAQ